MGLWATAYSFPNKQGRRQFGLLCTCWSYTAGVQPCVAVARSVHTCQMDLGVQVSSQGVFTADQFLVVTGRKLVFGTCNLVLLYAQRCWMHTDQVQLDTQQC